MRIGFIELERRVKTLEDRLAGQRKPLTFTDPECNTPCTASLEQKIERLAAYFEKRAKENTKRADDLDSKIMTTLPYYLSGKSDAYQRAAEKVREVLGEPKPVSYPMYTPTAEESKVWKDNPKWTEPMFKKPAEYPAEYPAVSSYSQQEIAHAVSFVASASVKPAEKWVIDTKAKGYPNDPWGPSGDPDVCGEFPSKAAADAAIAKDRATTVVRRARRID